MVHTSFARVGSANGTRASARYRLRLLRCIASPSSRYSRYTLLWLTRHRSVPSSAFSRRRKMYSRLIAESRTLGCQLPQPDPQRRFVPFPPPVPPAPAVHPDQPTGASLAEPCFFPHDTHRFSLRLRSYHFFASTTFSSSRSSACCATIFFSRPFSSSS